MKKNALEIAKEIFYSQLKISLQIKNQLPEYSSTFELIPFTSQEISIFLKDFYENVAKEIFSTSGTHRKDEWRLGWSGAGTRKDPIHNFEIPFYFGKDNILRLYGKLYKSSNPYAELLILRSMHLFAFEYAATFFDSDFAIAEYGCGTGHNILLAPKAHQKFGYDWVDSSFSKIKDLDPSIHLDVVDFFDPNTYKGPMQKYIIFTNDALEQTGAKFFKFMDFHMRNPNCIGGMHFEPIPNQFQGNLGIQSDLYHYARGYLTGFLEYIALSKEIEKISDYLAFSTSLGSKNMFSHHFIIWRK
jgi:hypothetical protein